VSDNYLAEQFVARAREGLAAGKEVYVLLPDLQWLQVTGMEWCRAASGCSTLSRLPQRGRSKRRWLKAALSSAFASGSDFLPAANPPLDAFRESRQGTDPKRV